MSSSAAGVPPRSRWAGAVAWLPCLVLRRKARPRSGRCSCTTCKSRQGRRRASRAGARLRLWLLHACWAPGRCRSSAASSRPRGMHSYALDQTLPCCYGTMVLTIARAQRPGANQGSDQQCKSVRGPITPRPSIEAAQMRTIVAAAGVGRNNSHSDASDQSRTGPITWVRSVVHQGAPWTGVSAGTGSDGSPQQRDR